MNPWVTNAIPVCLALLRAVAKALGLRSRRNSRVRNNADTNNVIDKDKINVEKEGGNS